MNNEHLYAECRRIVPPVDAFMARMTVGKVICTECKNDELKNMLRATT